MTASETTALPLSSIRRDGGTQPRAELHEEWAQEYAEDMASGASLPPVVVFYDGTDYWLADGFHRCRAAEISEQGSVNAEVVSGGRREAVLYSVSANGNHGHRRTNADKRRAVETLLRDNEWSAWSDREIARQCGVSPQTVNNYRAELTVQNGQSETGRTYTTRHGTTATMNTSNIGSTSSQVVEPETESQTDDLSSAPLNKSAEAEPQNHRAQGTGENEWYTPSEYIEAARRVLGTIDLDPASSEFAQSQIQASAFYTKDDDGLTQPWNGRIWLNPPYSQPAIQQFIEKLVEEIQSGRTTEAIILTHNYTDTRWFHLAASIADSVCFTKGRIGFVNAAGEKAAPTQGQAFFYFGNNAVKFGDEFCRFGFVVDVLTGQQFREAA